MDKTTISNDSNIIKDYIDADVCCEALAAIDTLARLRGKYGVKNSYTESVDNWVSKQNIEVPNDLLEKSRNALKAIAGENSELSELWGESEELDSWKVEILELEKRINA